MFEYPVRVYIEDTDAGGIVYYANYLKFFERARSEWLRLLGFTQQQLQTEGVRFVVSDLSIKYSQSAKLDDQVFLTLELISQSKASLTLNQCAYLKSDEKEDKLLTNAEIKLVCIDDAGKPRTIPDQLKKQILLDSQELP